VQRGQIIGGNGAREVKMLAYLQEGRKTIFLLLGGGGGDTVFGPCIGPCNFHLLQFQIL
jgi:hypothetical protein